LKLLLDHNLSPRIARSLQALFDQHEIVALRDKFSGNTPDPEWIEALDRERGWAVLTMDLRIRTRPHERAALDRTAIVYFFPLWFLAQAQDRRASLVLNPSDAKNGSANRDR
jgi:hypothetical protein